MPRKSPPSLLFIWASCLVAFSLEMSGSHASGLIFRCLHHISQPATFRPHTFWNGIIARWKALFLYSKQQNTRYLRISWKKLLCNTFATQIELSMFGQMWIIKKPAAQVLYWNKSLHLYECSSVTQSKKGPMLLQLMSECLVWLIQWVRVYEPILWQGMHAMKNIALPKNEAYFSNKMESIEAFPFLKIQFES